MRWMRWLPTVLIAFSLQLGVVLSASAQVGLVQYHKQQNFFLQPGGNVPPLVNWEWDVFALAVGPPPAVQAGNPGILRDINVGFQRRDAQREKPWAKASATSWVNLTAKAPQAVTGQIGVSGWAWVGPPQGQNARAESRSKSKITATARTDNGKGIITLGNSVSASLSGSVNVAQNVNVKDPMYIEIIDLDLNLLDRLKILDIELNMRSPGDANESTVEWDDITNYLYFNVVHDADLIIDIPGDYTDLEGKVKLSIRGGTITGSEDSGIFDGLFPDVGELGIFSVNMPVLEMEYDVSSYFGDPNNPEERYLGFILEGAGEAQAVIPEPATLLLFSVGMLPLIRRFRK
ncbi:MAG: hypothetical protein HPY54_11520 [Chthonomonadetes bacterium]|nr:hypothetical protein [Chthonomonadetes bacterium]